MNSFHARRCDIDWLRIFAVALLVPFHTARFYDEGWFYVKYSPFVMGFEIFVRVVHQFHMPLFFFISGVGTYFALSFQRTSKEYMKERFLRLFVPFAFGTLVIVPPQVYCRLLGNPGYHKNYFQFYPDFFNGIPPAGNFEWGHLWFLIYLFTFSLLALPLFLKWKRRGRAMAPIAELVRKPAGLVWFALPLAVIEVTLRPIFPGYQTLVTDWANFLYYITYFTYGYLLFFVPGFHEAVVRFRRMALGLALATLAALFVVVRYELLPDEGYAPGHLAILFVHAFNGWFFVLAFIGYGAVLLNRTGPVLKYASEAAMPFYVLHQTVIVVLARPVLGAVKPPFASFFIIMMLCFILATLIYEVLIKRINPLRVLFGMRARK